MPKNLQESLKRAAQLHQSGQLDEARHLLREILALEPHHPGANNFMGVLLIQSREPVKAARHIKRALRVDPENAQAHYNLGLAYTDSGRMPDAASAFGKAVQLDKSNPDFPSSLGNALRLAGSHAEAVRVLEDALRKASGHKGLRMNLALAQNDLGATLIRQGDPAQAMRHFLRAIELQPNHAQAHMNLGLTLEQTGEFDEAAKQYQHAILAKQNFTDAHFQLAHLRTHRSSNLEISSMKNLLDDIRTNEGDRIQLAYGLGFALESTEQYSKAFSYMQLAHKLQARRSQFDLAAASEQFSEIRRVFNQERLVHPESNGLDDKRPILVVGMPRSGTSLAEQILASHPAVHGKGESMAFANCAQSISRYQNFPNDFERIDEKDLIALARNYLTTLSKGTGDAICITDTTPMNFLFIGLAAMMLPAARFVFCVRNPMDNCLSVYRQMLTGANEFSHTLEDLGGYYRLHRELLRHWKDALKERVLCLQYEDLIYNHNEEVQRLIEFCGLPFDARCLQFYKTERVVRSPSAAQVRQPIYDTSIESWKRYENELEPLREALKIG